jgi:hypothetical protein
MLTNPEIRLVVAWPCSVRKPSLQLEGVAKDKRMILFTWAQ